VKATRRPRVGRCSRASLDGLGDGSVGTKRTMRRALGMRRRAESRCRCGRRCRRTLVDAAPMTGLHVAAAAAAPYAAQLAAGGGSAAERAG